MGTKNTPLTLEDAQLQIEQMSETIAQHEAQNKALTSGNEELKTENEMLKVINSDLTTKVEELSAELEKKSADVATTSSAVPVDGFESNGAKYRFTVPVFTWKGQRHVSAEIINNQALLDELVSKGVGFIVEV